MRKRYRRTPYAQTAYHARRADTLRAIVRHMNAARDPLRFESWVPVSDSAMVSVEFMRELSESPTREMEDMALKHYGHVVSKGGKP